MQLDVFADQGNRYLFLRVLPCVDHGTPLSQIRLRARKVQALAGNLSQMLLLHGKRCFVQDLYIQVLEYMSLWNVTEEGNLAAQAII